MLELIFFGFVAIVLAWVTFVFFTKWGRGVLFGGRIMKTYDGVSAKRRIFSTRVKVHTVDGGAVRFVGFEVATSSIGSYQMMPLSFPASEAKKLAQVLIEAAEYEKGSVLGVPPNRCDSVAQAKPSPDLHLPINRRCWLAADL